MILKKNKKHSLTVSEMKRIILGKKGKEEIRKHN